MAPISKVVLQSSGFATQVIKAKQVDKKDDLKFNKSDVAASAYENFDWDSLPQAVAQAPKETPAQAPDKPVEVAKNDSTTKTKFGDITFSKASAIGARAYEKFDFGSLTANKNIA